MRTTFYKLYNFFRGTVFHPQWLSDRNHKASRNILKDIENSLILDIGSGNSNNKQFLSQTNKIFRLDYPETNLHYLLLPDVYGDARLLPISDESIDIVFLFEVLEHIPNYEKVLGEIFRILKPGGKLYISVPFIYPIHDAPHDFHRFTIYGIRSMLKIHRFIPKLEKQHGNSFIVAMQLFNLALLETARKLFEKNFLAGLLFSIFSYLFCLLINLLAWPLSFLPSKSASCFGYFVIAERE